MAKMNFAMKGKLKSFKLYPWLIRNARRKKEKNIIFYDVIIKSKDDISFNNFRDKFELIVFDFKGDI